MGRKKDHADNLSHDVSKGSDTLPDLAVADALRARGWNLAVAESCTGGLLGGRITALPGSSDYFSGGIIAYSNRLKSTLLKVPEKIIADHGAVSEEVAVAMAAGLVRVTGTGVGLAITGVAGPSGSGSKPPGTVFVAITCPTGGECVELKLAGDRKAVREQAVSEALSILLHWTGESG